MFERFTGEARQAVKMAQDEARSLRQPSIGTGHLLLGLLAAGGPGAQVLMAHGLSANAVRQRLAALDDGLDPAALAALGIDFEQVKATTEAQLGAGALDKPRRPVPQGHLPLTRRAKKAIELALRESLRLKSGEIGTGHLLLGLTRNADGLAVELLQEAGIDPAALREEVASTITAQAA